MLERVWSVLVATWRLDVGSELDEAVCLRLPLAIMTEGEDGAVTMTICDVDVVVIGGGVTGLLTLEMLRAEGWSAILLENGELGGRQTSHSHVYIHRGHLYRKEALTGTLVPDLQLSATLWDEWLLRNEPHYSGLAVPHEEGLFGFLNNQLALECEALWDRVGLTCDPASLPQWMLGSAIRAVRSVSARCLNARWLVSALAQNRQDAILRIDAIDAFRRSWIQVEAVDVRLGDDIHQLRCSAVVMAAGSGNADLIERLDVSLSFETHDRPSFMMVIRGPDDVLPPITGIFELSREDALFIVSRTSHLSGETVWLVSDSCRQPTTGAWMRYVAAELDEVFPLLRERRDQLCWGVYEAPKAEVLHAGSQQRLVGSVVVEPVLLNTWAVWPTKLTLAPLAARNVVDEVTLLLEDRDPLPQPSAVPGPTPVPAAEFWERTETHPWKLLMELYQDRHG